jgi:hypothetical protein
MAGANALSDEALVQVRDMVRQEAGRLRGDMLLPRAPIAAGPEVFIVKAESAIPARSSTTPGKLADVPLYYIDRTGPTIEALLLNDGETPNSRDVYNVTLIPILAGDYAIFFRDKLGSWLAMPIGSGARRCCLAENHPGCGVVFDLKLGTCNPDTDEWNYEATASAHGIDFWYSVNGPYPDAGATGNFEPRPSDTYGTLWHALGNVSCDDDACGTCAEPT